MTAVKLSGLRWTLFLSLLLTGTVQAQVPLFRTSTVTETERGNAPFGQARVQSPTEALGYLQFSKPEDRNRVIDFKPENGFLSLDPTSNRRLAPNNNPNNSLKIDGADGGVSDGGGSGLACFDDQKTAKEALDSQGRLKERYRPLVRSIWATDYIENIRSFVRPLNSESPEQYLARIVADFITPLSPQFASQLTLALHDVRRETWKPADGLSAIFDVGETPHLEERLQFLTHCALVQIVRRQDFRNQGVVRVQGIEFDQELFENMTFSLNVGADQALKLSPVDTVYRRAGLKEIGSSPVEALKAYIESNQGIQNQALIIMHEALYFMGVKMGHTTSVKARQLASLLLSRDTYTSLKSNFDFLYLLYQTGFLGGGFFNYNESGKNPADSQVKYQRILALKEIFARVGERQGEIFKAQGHDCEKIQNDWDVSCLLLSSTTPWQSGVLAPYQFSHEELRAKPDALGFLAFVISQGSMYPEIKLEPLVIFGADDSSLIRKLCTPSMLHLDFRSAIHLSTQRFCRSQLKSR